MRCGRQCMVPHLSFGNSASRRNRAGEEGSRDESFPGNAVRKESAAGVFAGSIQYGQLTGTAGGRRGHGPAGGPESSTRGPLLSIIGGPAWMS